jgi:hypothetical protein
VAPRRGAAVGPDVAAAAAVVDGVVVVVAAVADVVAVAVDGTN